jgi:uncharacterized protein YeaO (DUF488 family)
MIKIKRVYEKIDVRDGTRVLIDGLWPRGVRTGTQNIDMWMKDVAPSAELRKWFAHDPAKWQDFRKRYKAELESNRAMSKLIALAQEHDPLTLLFSAKDEEHNNAVVLLEVLGLKLERIKKLRSGPVARPDQQ